MRGAASENGLHTRRRRHPVPAIPPSAELFFLSAGVLLLALGIPILIASLNVVEYKVPYAFEGPFAGRSAAERQSLLWSASDDAGVQYTVPILVEQRMEPPVRW